MAEAELLKALELISQAKWAYYHLGEIYQQEGRADEATVMHEQALRLPLTSSGAEMSGGAEGWKVRDSLGG
jgi:Tfp pilus assembly protein PilF